MRGELHKIHYVVYLTVEFTEEFRVNHVSCCHISRVHITYEIEIEIENENEKDASFSITLTSIAHLLRHTCHTVRTCKVSPGSE